MKIIKLFSISILLVAILSSCNLPGSAVSQTQTAVQNQAGTAAAMTLQLNPTWTPFDTGTPINTTPTEIASPTSTRIPPNTPVWSTYNYTCEFAVGGADMTMNLAWTDHSTDEEGYKVYRDQQLIATLAPDSAFYVDVAFVPTGKTLSYSVEAFGKDVSTTTSTITYGCQ